MNREHLEIDIREISSLNDQLMVGEEGNQITDSATSSIVLSKDLLNEARNRAGRNNIQVNSVLYRNPSLFVSSADLQKGTDGQASSLFGEGPLRQKRSSALGNVIAVDVENVEMVNLQTPVVINHLVFVPSQPQLNGSYFVTSHNASTELNIGNVTSHSVRRETSLKCIFWDFKLNQNTGGWSDSGCKLSSYSTNNGIINVTCSCNHMTNFGILLVSWSTTIHNNI